MAQASLLAKRHPSGDAGLAVQAEGRSDDGKKGGVAGGDFQRHRKESEGD